MTRDTRRRRLRARRRKDLDLEWRHRRCLRACSPAPAKRPARKGISAFIVPADTPGLTVAERIEVIAPHPLARLRFDNCRVPASKI
jgi:hypothetical protein